MGRVKFGFATSALLARDFGKALQRAATPSFVFCCFFFAIFLATAADLHCILLLAAERESNWMDPRNRILAYRMGNDWFICKLVGCLRVAVHIQQSLPDLIRTPKSSCCEIA